MLTKDGILHSLGKSIRKVIYHRAQCDTASHNKYYSACSYLKVSVALGKKKKNPNLSHRKLGSLSPSFFYFQIALLLRNLKKMPNKSLNAESDFFLHHCFNVQNQISYVSKYFFFLFCCLPVRIPDPFSTSIQKLLRTH